jgi:hypothetical protein
MKQSPRGIQSWWAATAACGVEFPAGRGKMGVVAVHSWDGFSIRPSNTDGLESRPTRQGPLLS